MTLQNRPGSTFSSENARCCLAPFGNGIFINGPVCIPKGAEEHLRLKVAAFDGETTSGKTILRNHVIKVIGM